MPLSPQEARDLVAVSSASPIVVIEPAVILTGSRLAEIHQLSFWDALVVEAGLAAGVSAT